MMLIGTSKSLNEVQVQIDVVEIQRLSENEFLGGITDDNISWKVHIKHIQSETSRSIAIINKARSVHH